MAHQSGPVTVTTMHTTTTPLQSCYAWVALQACACHIGAHASTLDTSATQA